MNPRLDLVRLKLPQSSSRSRTPHARPLSVGCALLVHLQQIKCAARAELGSDPGSDGERARATALGASVQRERTS